MMSALNRIAHFVGRRDEVPNQELAADLADRQDRAGIRELADHLTDRTAGIAADCIKVLYEIGERRPDLIAEYADRFVGLLNGKNNRMVWGGMSAISSIASTCPAELFARREAIISAVENGSVITVDRGIQALSKIAAHKPEYAKKLMPFLVGQLETCRPKDLPAHAEAVRTAVTGPHVDRFVTTLRGRRGELTAAQLKRVDRVLKSVEKAAD